MSTVMYAHRVKKSDWPALMRNLRRWGATKSALAQMELVPETDGNSWGDRLDAVEHALRNGDRQHRAEWEDASVEVQIFDRGPYYILRPLEQRVVWPTAPERLRDESFTNKLAEYLHHHKSTKLVRYDTRVEVPKDERRNAKIADWLDEQIKLGMYTVFSVVSLDDFQWRLRRRIWARADGKKYELLLP